MPPNRKTIDEARRANSMGVANCSWPRHIVAIQLKNLMPGRHRDEERRGAEERQADTAPVVNMWCAQTGIESAAIAEQREDHRAVAEDRLAREDRHDLGHDAERRQDQDVDLGMAEEPEQVLPQDGSPPLPALKKLPRTGGR